MSGDPNRSRPYLPTFTAGYTNPRNLAALFPRDPDFAGHVLPEPRLNPHCDGGHCREAFGHVRYLEIPGPGGRPGVSFLLCRTCYALVGESIGGVPCAWSAARGPASHLEPCGPGCPDCQHGPESPDGSALSALLDNCNDRRDVIDLADRMGLDTYDAEVIS